MKTKVSVVNTILGTVLLVIAGLIFGAPGAGAEPLNTQSTAADGLGEQVRHQLAILPWFGVFDNLEYQVHGSQVVLSGQVVIDTTKYDAERAVKNIAGVTQVENKIQILPLSVFDDQIRRAEYRAIFSQARLSRYAASPIPQIHIIVDGGRVTLEGVVSSEADKNVAALMANEVPGVFSVTNNLKIDEIPVQ